ncbi:MAG: putative integral rane protein [Bacteroidota bacterium]|nr:putative integral rane protein [Bacteroidota bacterium]
MPGRDIPHISFLELLSFDKFVHAGIFFVLILLTVRGLSLQTRFIILHNNPKSFAAFICITYGGLLEIMQATVFKERSADLYDFIANSFGCIVGIIFYNRIEKKFLISLIK